MGRPRGSANRLEVPDWAQPAFEQLLDGLGLDERALTEGYGTRRTQVNLNLRAEERIALDDAAVACGLGASPTLAKAIVRSWLIHSWNHPRELVDHDFGEGHRWSASIEAIKTEAEWPEGATGPEPVFATLIGRLDRGDLLAVALGLAAQMSAKDREALGEALVSYKARAATPAMAADKGSGYEPRKRK